MYQAYGEYMGKMRRPGTDRGLIKAEHITKLLFSSDHIPLVFRARMWMILGKSNPQLPKEA